MTIRPELFPMTFDFDRDLRRQLAHRLTDHIDQYYASLSERPVQLPAEQRNLPPLDNPLPEHPSDPIEMLDELAENMVLNGFHVASANYYGLMNCTPTYMAVLAEALVAALNPQLAAQHHSPVAGRIEREALRWIGSRVGWPGSFDGTFTSGGNEANFSGLALALANAFPGVMQAGVQSIDGQPVLYCSTEAHHSLDKSAGLLGLGQSAMRRIVTNDRAQLDVAKLEEAIAQDTQAGRKPFCVAATAGSTSSGAVDDLTALAGVCRRHRLWLHVDGAYGASAIFSDRHRDVLRGIELSDSITLDPHKWLSMPFAAGVILTSHPEALNAAFGTHTPYMPRVAGVTTPDNFQVSTQWSRRMNSLKFWLTLRVHGRLAYEEMMDRQFQLARGFAEWVATSGAYELAAPVYLPIVAFRVKAAGKSEQEIAALNSAVVEDVTRDGQRWISVTQVQGRSVIRMMIISYLTEQRHVEDLQDALAGASPR
jgi:glutamate/tyrosine decarboxylase-like PLP-dependent enzyme